MATNQTIASTLTADARPAVASLRTFNAEVGKSFTRLDQLNKRAFPSGGMAGSGGIASIGGDSSAAARGLLELSRGLEDATVGFGLNGLQGAVRGSMNNLSAMATMLGGPVAGAVAGFAAAGLSITAPYIASFLEGETAAERFGKSLDVIREKSKDLFESRVKERESEIDFRGERQGLGSSKDADSAIQRRREEVEKLNARLKEMEALRAGLFTSDRIGGDLEAQFGAERADAMRAEIAKADQLDLQLAKERLDLLRKEAELRVQIGQLSADKLRLLEQERELQKQKDAEEFSNIIRKFQEEDAHEQEQEDKRRQREAEREADRQRDKAIRDSQRLEGLLESRLRGVGGTVDPLDGMDNIPPELRERISGLLGQADELSRRPRVQLAQVATADSQSLLRSQYQAKEAAERRKEAAKLQKSLEDLLREVRESRRAMQAEADKDDVNLT